MRKNLAPIRYHRYWIRSTAAVATLAGLLTAGLFTLPEVAAEDAGNLYNTAVDIRMGQRYFERWWFA